MDGLHTVQQSKEDHNSNTRNYSGGGGWQSKSIVWKWQIQILKIILWTICQCIIIVGLLLTRPPVQNGWTDKWTDTSIMNISYSKSLSRGEFRSCRKNIIGGEHRFHRMMMRVVGGLAVKALPHITEAKSKFVLAGHVAIPFVPYTVWSFYHSSCLPCPPASWLSINQTGAIL